MLMPLWLCGRLNLFFLFFFPSSREQPPKRRLDRAGCDTWGELRQPFLSHGLLLRIHCMSLYADTVADTVICITFT
jgi:hypothetical protein